MRTEPVKFSAGLGLEGCEPLRVIVIGCDDSVEATGAAAEPGTAVP
jgi:hypothetical protein